MHNVEVYASFYIICCWITIWIYCTVDYESIDTIYCNVYLVYPLNTIQSEVHHVSFAITYIFDTWIQKDDQSLKLPLNLYFGRIAKILCSKAFFDLLYGVKGEKARLWPGTFNTSNYQPSQYK